MQHYDPLNPVSIVSYAKELEGKTMREVGTQGVENHGYRGKGNYGQILERFYFGKNLDSESRADFPEAGIELKATPLKQLTRPVVLRAKERLVLGLIDYMKIIKENFSESSFWQKNAHLLLVFYLYEQGIDILDYQIKLVDEWKFPEKDLEIIKRDWETIVAKVEAGKAHELSEGDTFYLSACRKGQGGDGRDLREQPKSEIRAKQRAYSFKGGYVNHILATLTNGELGKYKPVLKEEEIKSTEHSLEEIIEERFKKFYGKDIHEIARELKTELNIKDKSMTARLVGRIMGIDNINNSEEFDKASILVKAVRLQETMDSPKEGVSFPKFEYKELYDEEWEDSDLLQDLERKYFWVFFKFSGERLFLKKVMFWSMPDADVEEAKKVWIKTKELLKEGKIFSHMRGKSRMTYFPKMTENRVSHVRPHGRNSADVSQLPVIERTLKVEEYTKQCFWLNAAYVGKIYRDSL